MRSHSHDRAPVEVVQLDRAGVLSLRKPSSAVSCHRTFDQATTESNPFLYSVYTESPDLCSAESGSIDQSDLSAQLEPPRRGYSRYSDKASKVSNAWNQWWLR